MFGMKFRLINLLVRNEIDGRQLDLAFLSTVEKFSYLSQKPTEKSSLHIQAPFTLYRLLSLRCVKE